MDISFLNITVIKYKMKFKTGYSLYSKIYNQSRNFNKNPLSKNDGS